MRHQLRRDHAIACFLLLGIAAVRWMGATLVYLPEALAVTPWAFGYEEGNLAGSLASGRGFAFCRGDEPCLTTAWNSPLYPLLLAGLFKLLGAYTPAAANAAIGLNCLLHGLACALVYLLGLRLGGRRVGAAAAALLAVAPNAWRFLGWAWHTHLSAVLILAHVGALLALAGRGAGAASRPIAGAALAGAALGLAMLADGAAVMLLPASLFWAWRARRLPAVAAAAFGTLAVLSPWTVRNYLATGSLNPLRSSAGVNLWVGNHPQVRAESYHGLQMNPWHNRSEWQQFAARGDRAYDRFCRDRAVARISAEPARFVADTAARASGFWLGEWWAGYGHIHPVFSLGLVAYTVLAACGAWRGRRHRTGVLLTVILLAPLPYYITVHGHGRYRAPLEPVLCLLAGFVAARDDRPGAAGLAPGSPDYRP